VDLTAYHHDEQKRIARWVVSELSQAWLLLDFSELKETTTPWLKSASPMVEQGRLMSASAAVEFVKLSRSAARPGADELITPEPTLTRERRLKIAASLTVTGPVWVAQHSQPGMSRDDIPKIMQAGFSKASGAVVRMVLNGGRGAVRDLVLEDRLTRGIVGIADPDACKSCLFLTKPIMKSAGMRKINAVSVGHDFCTCSAKPIY
jgi:hypothetical protein